MFAAPFAGILFEISRTVHTHAWTLSVTIVGGIESEDWIADGGKSTH